jgi:hypothetical protein
MAYIEQKMHNMENAGSFMAALDPLLQLQQSTT